MPEGLERLKKRLRAQEAQLRSAERELERERGIAAARARQLGGLEDRIEAQAAEIRRQGELLARSDAVAHALRAGDASGAALAPAVGWWQSPVIAAELRRRLSGDPLVAPERHVLRTHLRERVPRALVVGEANLGRAWRLRRLGLCDQVVCLDSSPERVRSADGSLSDVHRQYVEFVADDVISWRPAEPFPLVLVSDALRERDAEHLAAWAAGVCAAVGPGGWLCVYDTVNPPAHRPTPGEPAPTTNGDRAAVEVEITQRILDRLSPALRTDLQADDGRLRDRVVAAEGDDDANGRQRIDDIVAGLSADLQPIEVKPYGGALLQRLFTAIMGNFAGHDDLVRVVAELDAILTDHGVIESSWLWGVWRRPPDDERRPGRTR